jgi:hypothetical protein
MTVMAACLVHGIELARASPQPMVITTSAACTLSAVSGLGNTGDIEADLGHGFNSLALAPQARGYF